MADASFDAVIVGGGTKALPAACYLAKYGGMKVGVFERRHELGGGLSTIEHAAPGFWDDTHATIGSTYYFLPMEQDFPDFVEKGGKLLQYKMPAGIITRENHECCYVYNEHEDPTQEKTARVIARFAGEKDAETYLKIWEYAHRPESSQWEAENATRFNLPPLAGEKSARQRWWENFLKQPGCPIDAEWLSLPLYKAALRLFKSPRLAFFYLRNAQAASMFPTEPWAPILVTLILGLPLRVIIAGGTHSVAHAYARILLENGSRFFTHSNVTRIIMENGTARGIRLADGTEVEARRLVLTDVNLDQLFDLVGREYFSQDIIKQAGSLGRGMTTIAWYTWALSEYANFRAADYDPNINQVMNLALASEDIDVLVQHDKLKRQGKEPPTESSIFYHAYSLVDGCRAPAGMNTVLTEQYVLAANQRSEREWLEFKKIHAEDVMREFQVYTTNLNWDKVAGYGAITPYDTAGSLINMAPCGDMLVYNLTPRPPAEVPLPEFSRHRIPGIKNLYATGAAWQPSGNCNAGYTCYKVIAEDLGLRKPWEEKGRPW